MLTQIDLCSRALLKIGERPIASLTEDSAAAKIAASLYDPAIDALLCAHRWRFATKKIRLSKTPDGDFLLPPGVLRVTDCDAAEYDIVGSRVAAAADEIEITAIVRAGADLFPSYFQAAAATRLAMEFCVPLTGNQNARALLNALYENELRAAKFADSASARVLPIGDFPLLSARF
jgi:hypothetical protein